MIGAVQGWFCARCGHEAGEPGACPRDGGELARVSSHDLIGRRLGEYTVLAALGGGSFGTVYRAVHARSGLLVAIKLLHQPIDQAESQRVITEARAAATLQHPNVVQVYDLALTTDRRPYIVMQLLDGSSLASVAQSPLPVAFAVSIARDILAGLAVAHARGVIHRDLKPDNVFVAAGRAPDPDRPRPGGEPARGRAIVVDFGLAKLIADPRAPNLTVTGDAIGTPAFMAPEQITSRPVDHRADLYAVGCVLFALLAGRPPFEGSTFVLFEAHTRQAAPSIASLRPDVPAHVDAAIARALAKSPADRFADANEMARALAGQPVARRRRWPWAAAAAAAIAAIAIVAFTASGASTAAPVPADAARRRVVVPTPEGPADERLEGALAMVAENLEAGRYPRDQLLRMRCELARTLRELPPGTPAQLRSYHRRFAQLLDGDLAGVDLAAACAPRRRSSGVPPPLRTEPPLDDALEDALETLLEQLAAGRIQRPLALQMVCGIYVQRDGNLVMPDVRAFGRRQEALLRRYFPDLDAAECPR